MQATEDQIVVSGACILGRKTGAGPAEELTGADVAAQLPAATSSADGKMTAAQAEMVAFLAAGCFGGIHVHDATASQSIASGSTYTKATCFTDNDPASNCTSDAANDKILITKTGYYKVSCGISYTSLNNNVALKMAVFMDGVEQNNIHSEFKICSCAAGCVAFFGIIDCTSTPAEIDLRFAQGNGSSIDIIVRYANLNVQWIGNT